MILDKDFYGLPMKKPHTNHADTMEFLRLELP